MQHYGYRSFFVDVTFDPKIALWFSFHHFESKQIPLYVDSDLRSAVFQCAKYSVVDNGFFYIIKLPKEDLLKRFVDLRTILPDDAKRIHRQKAGAVFCSEKNKSIDELIVAKIKVKDDGWFKNSSDNISSSTLFPCPSVDQFYRCLCNIPYFINSENVMNKIELGHPLLGFIPIYAKSNRELLIEYVPLTRIISKPNAVLEWDISTQVVDFEGLRTKTRGSKWIILPSLMINKIVFSHDKINKDILLTSWPSENLLIEFEPEASLVSPSPKTPDEIIRGIWVIIGKKTLMISQIIDRFSELTIGHTCIYSIPELKLQKKECSCKNHRYELNLFLKTTGLLNTKMVYLEKAELGYFNLKYNSNNQRKIAEEIKKLE